VNLTVGRTKMGNEKNLFERWYDWTGKHTILWWGICGILAVIIFGVKDWFESEPKTALNVKSEIIAEQEFTPNQTILLKMTENLLKWDKSAQDNFTMLWGRDLFNHYNFNMSNRKPKLETLKPCLMENENSLIPNLVVVNCITKYWLK
jgi:hypothetical protein